MSNAKRVRAFYVAPALAIVLALLLPWVAVADDIVVDGDGLTPVATSALNFGSVCAGTTTSKSVIMAIKRNGSGVNTYANNAVVAVSIGTTTGAGLSASISGSPTITLPSNWTTIGNNVLSPTVTSSVTLVAGAAGPFNGAVPYVASSSTLTRSSSLTVTASIVNCDNDPPVISVPTDVTAEATGPSGAVVSYSATATDANPAHPAVTCAPISGSTFALGATTVNCSATDAAGNTGHASFVVTVQDTTPPDIAGTPSNLTAEAADSSGAVVTYDAPSAGDLVDGGVGVDCAPSSGATFALGATTVVCSATDASGNTATRQFTVTVSDTTAPTLTLPANLTEEATGPAGAAVSYSATASDVVDGAVPADCAPTSGATFALGDTTVNCSAGDAHGNTASGSFTVTVQDTTAPALLLPTPAPIEATGPAGAAATFTPTADDLVDGSVAVNCAPASGATFALGATTVTCSATDSHGNTAHGNFDVTVVDTTPPALTLPADQLLEATGPSGASATFAASASDLVDGAVSASCDATSGATFPLGVTTVHCQATDAAGNAAQGSFTIEVEDTTAPSLSLPSNLNAEATGPAGAAVNFAATASDLVDGVAPVNCAPASGATFALGTTTVNCSATDAHGNSASGSFTVTVADTAAPIITVPSNITTDPTSAAGALVNYSASANDAVDGLVGVNCAPASGSTFAFGVTTVACQATDSHGNQGQASFVVSVKPLTMLGFYQPVDMSGSTTVYNTVKSGATVPIKFEVFAGNVELTSANAVQQPLVAKEVSCSSSAPVDDIETTATGNTSLRYDATSGQFIYNWQTPSGKAGKCYSVTVKAADGSTSKTGYFKLK